jgi:hypothetical protein
LWAETRLPRNQAWTEAAIPPQCKIEHYVICITYREGTTPYSRCQVDAGAPAKQGESTMSTQSMPAKRMVRAGIIMSALWLGAATLLVLQAHGNDKLSPKVTTVSSHTFSFLEVMSNAYLDNLPIR